jgi:hypothetical protein
MNAVKKSAHKQRLLLLLTFCMLLNSCLGAVVGTAVDVTIEVVKVPFKVAGAAVDLVIPDDEC